MHGTVNRNVVCVCVYIYIYICNRQLQIYLTNIHTTNPVSMKNRCRISHKYAKCAEVL